MTALLAVLMSVASEDTVLYTAQAYVDKQRQRQQRNAAVAALSQVIRCPQLSPYWLGAMVHSSDAPKLLLAAQTASIKRLLLAQLVAPVAALDGATLTGMFEDASLPPPPDAWLLPRRATAAVLAGGVRMTWALPLSELQDVCRRCKETQAMVWLPSPSVTAPLGGLAWRLEVQCIWKDGGVRVGLFSGPADKAAGCLHTHTAEIIGGRNHKRSMRRSYPHKTSRGWPDFFALGPMAEGWDAAAWAAERLPATGMIELSLRVTDVNGVKYDK
jgi:hypothetical protein